jgi:hypothetical protein
MVDPKCRAFVYYASTSTCYLKSSLPSSVVLPGATSGFKVRTLASCWRLFSGSHFESFLALYFSAAGNAEAHTLMQDHRDRFNSTGRLAITRTTHVALRWVSW